MTEPFWLSKPLSAMSLSEWESICDGCAKCCLHKLEDEDTGQIVYTSVACTLLDTTSCRCSDYTHRLLKVPDCLKLTPENLYQQTWLPSSCGYRLLSEGKPLPAWHPLVSGQTESVHQQGASVRGKVISEQLVQADDFEDYVIHWVDSPTA